MRIGLYNNSVASELNSQQVTSQSSAKTASSTAEDRATLSSDATSVSSLVSKALETPATRQSKVDGLRQAISNGQYKIEPDEIAASIVDDYA